VLYGIRFHVRSRGAMHLGEKRIVRNDGSVPTVARFEVFGSRESSAS
jgi:hypothetical protein